MLERYVLRKILSQKRGVLEKRAGLEKGCVEKEGRVSQEVC